ncbi:hypothetical protein [Acidovorax sp. Root219]|uniref:DUF6932 family protein n=1 Tax=Acidovorax sp. Root219 TaxID=1736493 RepID=UPI0012FA17CB|nr:hypothetical protein [Acidovorax sp. Root219]
MKVDAPPLLPAGIHHLTSFALKELAVDAFPADTRRGELLGKFLAWREALRSLGVGGIAWIDGSFLTSKIGPDDIDLIFWSPSFISPLNSNQERLLASLLDKAACRALFDLDVYCESPPPHMVMHREAYWKGLFGFGHDGRTAKGIAEVVI